MAINRYEVYIINLDPTIGHEIKKTRPCLIISPNEMNRQSNMVLVALMTTKTKEYPMRISTVFRKLEAQILLDQIRTVDKRRLKKCLGEIQENAKLEVRKTLIEMFS